MLLLWFFSVLLVTGVTADEVTDISEELYNEQAKLAQGEQVLSNQILKILEHFQKEDPVGLPGAQIPDPYPIPDMKKSFPVAQMTFKNIITVGLSKFRIKYVNAEIASMQVNAAMTIDKLQVFGNYTMATWLSRSQGPFVVNLTNIFVTGKANLAIERDGKLRAQDISMDISFKTISLNFENLGFFGSIFQGIMNNVGTFLFDSIKPYVLKEAYTKIREEINLNLDKVAGDVQFPNSISPLDMVIIDTRKIIRNKGLDPYKVKDYNSTVGIFAITLSHTWVHGISSFHRVGNITLRLENNTVIADFEIGTQVIEGDTQWEVSAMGGVASRAGTASFTIDYISARVILAQPLDTRKRPEFRNWQLDLGNIQVRCDGAGTMDYVIEFVVNVLPNLLRYQIVDAVEGPIRDYCQTQFLNKIDVQDVIISKLPEVERLSKSGIKLSTLMAINDTNEIYDEEDFFNF